MVKQKIKKLMIGTILCCTVLCSGKQTEAFVTGDISPGISVMSINTASSNLAINISNYGVAKISAGVAGKFGTSKISMTVKLQKYDKPTKKWKNIKIWEQTQSGSFSSFSKSYQLTQRGSYRAKLFATVWKNGNSETISFVTNTKYY